MLTTIILVLLSLILIAYAAVCNAKMDTVKDHWSTSIYSNPDRYDAQWFNPAISWTNKDDPSRTKTFQLHWLPVFIRWVAILKPAWDPISDFWHWQKTQMLVCLIAAPALLLFATLDDTLLLRMVTCIVYFIVGGLQWISVFNLFYNHKLKQ